MATDKNEKLVFAGVGLVTFAATVGGLVLLIVGIVMHSHNSGLSSICNSGLGQLGQSVDSQAQASCTHASTLSDLGLALAIGGAFVLLWGIKMSSGAFLAAVGSAKSTSAEAPENLGLAKEPLDQARQLTSNIEWNALIKIIGVSNPRDFNLSMRRQLSVPLDVLQSHLQHGETVERIAGAACATTSGLIVFTDYRVLFFDSVSGILELEFDVSQSAITFANGILTIGDSGGLARFSNLVPGTPATKTISGVTDDSPMSAVHFPRLRQCGQCGGEFTPILTSDHCPDCGGELIPV